MYICVHAYSLLSLYININIHIYDTGMQAYICLYMFWSARLMRGTPHVVFLEFRVLGVLFARGHSICE